MALHEDGKKIWWHRSTRLGIWDGEDWGGRFKVKGEVSLLSKGIALPPFCLLNVYLDIPPRNNHVHPIGTSSPSLPNDRPPETYPGPPSSPNNPNRHPIPRPQRNRRIQHRRLRPPPNASNSGLFSNRNRRTSSITCVLNSIMARSCRCTRAGRCQTSRRRTASPRRPRRRVARQPVPALGDHFLRVGAPRRFGEVGDGRHEEQGGSGRDEGAAEGHVGDGFAVGGEG